jgi:hypothetical protein
MAGPGGAVDRCLAPVAAGLAALLLACASPGVRPEEPAPGEPSAAAESEAVRQAHFRVRYRGVDGRGRLRLTLRSTPAGAFTLQAADSFGRQVWSFQSDGAGSLLVDHRSRQYCRLGGDVVLRAVALSELPVAMLPRVLHGELPSPPPEDVVVPSAGDVDFQGGDGRRWSARSEDGRVVSWTLWQDGAPLVWWQRDGAGGILSHRDGAQALWTMVAEEVTTAALGTLQVPADYESGDCDGGDVS